MGIVICEIERATNGHSFDSHRYSLDDIDQSSIVYEDQREIVWKEYGETEKLRKPIYLKREADKRAGYPSAFCYFLDGSRRTYRIDDMAFGKNIYPIVVRQVGVGYTVRDERLSMHPVSATKPYIIVVLPDKAFSGSWDTSDQI